MTRTLLSILLPAAFLLGCASSFIPFTEDTRSTADLSTAVLHLPSSMTLRSLRLLEPLDDKGPFKNDGHRYMTVTASDTGRIQTMGAGWITVNFGRGIILRFERTASGAYAMPGWGTLTIDGERYDLMLGILSGEDIQLMLEPSRPS
jgi:hypothetical protein